MSGWLRSIRSGVFSLATVLAALAGGGSACTSAWNESGPPPFTAAETNNALRPLKALEQRCYEGSESQHNKQKVLVEFILYIGEKGEVRSEPVGGDLVPPIIECLRTGLDTLKFPAKGVSDQLRVTVQLGT